MHVLKTLPTLALFVLSFSASAAEPLKLFPGWPALAGAGTSAKVADPAVAEVVITPQGVQVTGHKEGSTTVTIARPGGTSETLTVEVAGAGWKLAPVLAAARDLPEGTIVEVADLKARQLPSFAVTSSVVRPDSANYIIRQKLLVPVQAGDLVLWSAFETVKTK